MKKIICLLFLFIVLPVRASVFLPVENDKNMYYWVDMTRIYEPVDPVTNFPNYRACFVYENIEKAKITGKVFNYELACIENKAGSAWVGYSAYYFFDTKTRVIGKTPYYFNKVDTLKKAIDYADSYLYKSRLEN